MHTTSVVFHKLPSCDIVLKKKNASAVTGYIALRISVPGKGHIFKNTGHIVRVADWDDKGRLLRKQANDSAYINDDITSIAIRVRNALQQHRLTGSPFTAIYLRSLIVDDTPKHDFLLFYKQYLEDAKKPRKTRSGTMFSLHYTKSIALTYNHLATFANGSLPYEQITFDFLTRFDAYLSQIVDNYTTLPTYMKRLSKLLKLADAQGFFDMKTIGAYSWPSYQEPVRPYLTLDETIAIGDKLYSGAFDHTGPMRDTAAFFLVECYAGIRYSDWARFSIEKLLVNDSLKVAQAKKTQEPIYVPLHKSPLLKRVIEYIRTNELHYPYTIKCANEQLKEIAKACGITRLNLSTHVGRHTCATLLLQIGYSTDTIAAWLGISKRTVDTYAKMTRRKITIEYEKLGGL